MGLPIKELYITNPDPENLPDRHVLLTGTWKPVKKGERWIFPAGTPIGLDIWVPNIIGATEDEGPVRVEVVKSDSETGLWVICVNDYFGNEKHLYTTKPIHKPVEERFGDYKGFRDWTFDDENDINEGWGLHVCVTGADDMEAGDEPIPVTLRRI